MYNIPMNSVNKFTFVITEEKSYGCHVNAVTKSIKAPIINIDAAIIFKKLNFPLPLLTTFLGIYNIHFVINKGRFIIIIKVFKA